VLSYLIDKKKIIIACMALHNFIRDSNLSGEDFNRLKSDETYADGDMGPSTSNAVDEEDMRQVRDAIAQVLI
jgi:hypothetical protein